jgi:RNase P subunit RPR2
MAAFLFSFLRGNIDPDQGRAKTLMLDCNKRQIRKSKMGGVALARSQICPCCGTVLKQPDWSERVSEQQMAYVWRCTNCGSYSETRDKSYGHEPSAAELAEKFLPKLVVE